MKSPLKYVPELFKPTLSYTAEHTHRDYDDGLALLDRW